MAPLVSVPASLRTPLSGVPADFHAKLTYDLDTLAILSANEDAGTFFACPSSTLINQSIADLPWPDALDSTVGEGIPQEGKPEIRASFASGLYWRALLPARPLPLNSALPIYMEVDPLELPDRTLMLVSLRLATDSAPSEQPATRNPRDNEQAVIGRLARCLIWHADVFDIADGKQDWDIHVLSEEAANEFLPLHREPGQEYASALFYSRLPEDSERMTQDGPVYVRANQNYSQEYRVRTLNGEIRWLKEDVNIEPVAPGRWRAVGVCTDITERKQAEEAQNYIMHSARCLMWQAQVRLNAFGTLDWMAATLSEDAAQEFLPLDVPPDSTYWMTFAHSRMDEDRQNADRLSAENILANRDYSQEYRQMNRYGEIRWLHEDVRVESVGSGLWHLVGVCTDVTELKQAQELQQHVTRSARCLIWHGEVTHDTSSLAEFEWEVKAISEEIAADFLPLDVPDGSHYMKTMTANRLKEDDLRTWETAIQALLANRNYSQEFRVLDKYGRIWWLREDVRVEPIGPGKWRCVGVCTDVTELKQAELQREASQQQLRQVTEQANCLLWRAEVREVIPDTDAPPRVFDPKTGSILDWNLQLVNENEMLRWLPIEPREGESITAAWYGSRHPEDREAGDATSWKCLASDADRYTQTYRTFVQGGVRWLQEDVRVERLEPYLEQGAEQNEERVGTDRNYLRRWRLTGVVTDITEMKRAQEIQQYVARSARCLLWYADVSEFEPRQETILRWDIQPIIRETGQDFIPLTLEPGQSYLEAMYHSRKLANENLTAIHRCGTDNLRANRSFSQEYRVFDKDGAIRWLREDVNAAAVGPGRWRCVGVCTDITEMKRVEEAQLRSQKLEALGTLAGGIAHDFNNILCAILGNTQLAALELPPGNPAQEMLKEIMKAGSRSTELIRQILAFSRPQEQNRKSLSLEPIVTEALSLLRATLPTTIEVCARFAPDVPSVLADPTQVHQSLVNLATNAAHAITVQGRSGGRIEVRLDVADVTGEWIGELTAAGSGLPVGRYARVCVTDNGCGMDRETLARAFDPFFTTKAVGEGTGLGLSVVHGIMKSHGGTVTVYSQPGTGSTFRLYFPAAVGPAESAVPTAVSETPSRLAGKHILYVDDEEAVIRFAHRILERLGHTVTACTHSAEALALFGARPQGFDAVITDLSMPGMSGFDLTRRLLEIRPDTVVVMTSGYVRPEDEVTARQLGIREVLLKPFNLSDLLRVLDLPTDSDGGPNRSNPKKQ